MSPIKLTVEFEWQPIGSVELDGSGRLVLPKVPLRPGLYRFELDRGGEQTMYIGETDQLIRRFQHYRTPGPSQSTNIRFNALIHETLKARGSVAVAVANSAAITINGQTRAADMSQKSERVLLEHAALCAARESGETILNL